MQNLRIETKHLVTTIAGIFAMVSVQNVAQFFMDMGHYAVPSWTLGLAIGTVLVTLAHLLAEVDMRDRRAFYGLLSVTTILVGLSVFVQGMEYAPKMEERGLHWWAGYLLALVIVGTGEIILPLAHSWFKEAQRRQAVLTAGARAEEMAAETLVKTLGSLDLSRAKAKAEARLGDLVAMHVDKIVKDLAPELDMSEGAPADNRTDSGQIVRSSVQTANNLSGHETGTPEETLLAILDNGWDGLPPADVKRNLAARFPFSEKTAARRLAKLEEAGKISLNGIVEVRQ